MIRRTQLLVVDSRPCTARRFRRILGQDEYEILEAADCESALRMAGEHAFDLVLIHAGLAGNAEFCPDFKSGSTFADSILALIMEEAHGLSARDLPVLSAGMEVFIEPFRDAEVAGRIRSLVNLRSLRLALRASEQNTHRLLKEETTERKRAEEAENKYRVIFENATEGMFQTTPDGRYLSANPALARMFGYDSPGELIATIYDIGFQTYVIPAKREELKRLLESSDHVQGFEAERFRKDGRRFWMSINGHAVRDASGAVLYYEGTNQDITGRKLAETVLRQSEEKFRSFFEFAPIGVALHNAEGKYVQTNLAYQKMLGYAQAELRRLGVRRVTHSEDVPEAQCLFAELREGKRDHYRREKRYWAKDGRVVWAHASASAVRDDSGRLRYIISMVEDITERKRTQEALAKTENLQKAILDNIPDPAWLKDADGRFLACNRQLARLFGQTTEAVVGKTVSDFILWEADRQEHRDGAVLQSPKPVSSEECLVDAQGKMRWFETIRTPVLDEFGAIRGTVGIAREVTERKWVESLLQLQRDFGTFLGSINDLRAAVERLLKIVLQTEGVDCGAVYLVDDKTGELNLAGHQGLSADFVRRASRFGAAPAQLELSPAPPTVQVASGGPMSAMLEQLRNEGLSAMEIIPIQHAAKVVAVLCLGSRLGQEIPLRSCQVLEAIAAQAGGAIARIRAEQSLGASRQLLEKTLHSLHAAVFMLDAGTFLILDCNPAATQIFGYTRDELIGRSMDILHLDEMRLGQFRRKMAARNNGALMAFEMKMRKKNGSPFSSENILRPIKDDEGKTLSWIAVVHDVTNIKRAEEDLRQLSRRIIEAQESERLRVARDLHDGVNQVIASAKMRLSKVSALSSNLSPSAREIIARCNELLVQALEENRRIAYNLRPSELDDLGLASACRNFCKDVELRTQLSVKCCVNSLAVRLPQTLELNLFRIAQEALNNIEKHAQATRARLQITVNGKSVLLKIQDDGRGFEPQIKPAKGKRRGIGLTNMRERAASLGGTCEIKSAPKRGTAITVRVPLELSSLETPGARTIKTRPVRPSRQQSG